MIWVEKRLSRKMNNVKANKEEVNNMTLVTSSEVVVASISTMEDMANLNKKLSPTYLRTLM
jgi:hypothetical protein